MPLPAITYAGLGVVHFSSGPRPPPFRAYHQKSEANLPRGSFIRQHIYLLVFSRISAIFFKFQASSGPYRGKRYDVRCHGRASFQWSTRNIATVLNCLCGLAGYKQREASHRLEPPYCGDKTRSHPARRRLLPPPLSATLAQFNN
jgi:hypothetical protein